MPPPGDRRSRGTGWRRPSARAAPAPARRRATRRARPGPASGRSADCRPGCRACSARWRAAPGRAARRYNWWRPRPRPRCARLRGRSAPRPRRRAPPARRGMPPKMSACHEASSPSESWVVPEEPPVVTTVARSAAAAADEDGRGAAAGEVARTPAEPVSEGSRSPRAWTSDSRASASRASDCAIWRLPAVARATRCSAAGRRTAATRRKDRPGGARRGRGGVTGGA